MTPRTRRTGADKVIPKSMSVGKRNVLRSNDSRSLWNCTLSPGWTREQAEVLRKALLKFGVGNWKEIVDYGCLPGKTTAQLNLQTQRMLGQQSTAEFQGLHIDPLAIGRLNSLKRGPGIKRKNGYIINLGGKLTKQERLLKIQENRKYEWPREAWTALVLPTPQQAQAVLAPASMKLLDSHRDDPISDISLKIKEKEMELDLLTRELGLVQKWIKEKIEGSTLAADAAVI